MKGIKLVRYWIKTGKYFGYPKCCIKEFCLLDPINRTEHQKDRNIHKSYGFIPCAKHAKQIADGKITLEDLIQNRKCKTAYPDQSAFKHSYKLIWKKIK